MRIVETQIELFEDFLPNSDLLYDIYYDDKMSFEARLNEDDNKGRVGVEDAPKVLKYTLNKPLKKFTLEEIDQILDYRGLKFKDDGFEAIDVFIEKSFVTLLNPPSPYSEQELIEFENKHEDIRNILINSGSIEVGDNIIDEICGVVGIPPTTVYYKEI